jgi:RNA polymerase sigma factor (sigma-70 family)
MTKLRSGHAQDELRALLGGGSFTGLGEGQLLDRFLADRDEAAFTELIARHGPMVQGICRRWLDDPHDIEDAFQATFLILLRKAASLRDRESLSNWLFGVSLRVARRSRFNSERRRSHERSCGSEAAMTSTISDDPADREVMTIVDQEIQRLPEKQQAAVVLCLVQGRTHDAAARELGWPIGTVKSRLASARATLTRRLTRRGVSPSVVLVLGQISDRFSAVAVPQDITIRTLEAVLQTVAGRAVQGAVLSATVQTLVHGILRAMLLSRIKLAAVAFTVLGALVWAAPAILIARPAEPPETPASATPQGTITVAPRTSRVDLYGDPLPPGAAVRLGTVRHRQESPIYKIAYSPDGKYVVTDGDDDKLRVWDGDTGQLVRQIDSGTGWSRDFTFSRDGKLLAAERLRVKDTDFLNVAVNDPATGQRESQSSWDLQDRGLILKFSPDGRRVAVGAGKNMIRVLETATGAEHSAFTIGPILNGPLAFSPAGNRLAVVTTEEKCWIHIIDLDRKKVLRVIPTVRQLFYGLGFSADGDKLVGYNSGQIDLWDLAKGRGDIFELYPAQTMTFSADGRGVAGFNLFGAFAIWNLATFGPQFAMKLGTSSNFVNFAVRDWSTAAFSPDDRTLATNGGQSALHFWDIATKRDRLAMPEAHSGCVDSILVTSNGKTVITSSPDATVRVWDVDTGVQRRSMELGGRPRSIALSSDERWLLAISQIREGVYLWDLQNEKAAPIISTEVTSGWAIAACFSKPDNRVQVYWSDGRLRGLNLETGRSTVGKDISAPGGILVGPEQAAEGGTFLSGGRRLCTYRPPDGLRIADIETGKLLYSVPDADDFAVSRDERLLACSRSVGVETTVRLDRRGAGHASRSTILLLDGETGKEQFHIDVPGSSVWALAFSPDGKTLAYTTGWAQGEIHLYDVATRKETRTITTAALRTSGVAFTPDGSRLISGMADTSILVWDLRDGQ